MSTKKSWSHLPKLIYALMLRIWHRHCQVISVIQFTCMLGALHSQEAKAWRQDRSHLAAQVSRSCLNLPLCLSESYPGPAKAKKSSQLEREFASRKFPSLKSRPTCHFLKFDLLRWCLLCFVAHSSKKIPPSAFCLQAYLFVDNCGGCETQGCPSWRSLGWHLGRGHLPCGGLFQWAGTTSDLDFQDQWAFDHHQESVQRALDWETRMNWETWFTSWWCVLKALDCQNEFAPLLQSWSHAGTWLLARSELWGISWWHQSSPNCIQDLLKYCEGLWMAVGNCGLLGCSVLIFIDWVDIWIWPLSWNGYVFKKGAPHFETSPSQIDSVISHGCWHWNSLFKIVALDFSSGRRRWVERPTGKIQGTVQLCGFGPHCRPKIQTVQDRFWFTHFHEMENHGTGEGLVPCLFLSLRCGAPPVLVHKPHLK